MAVAAVHATDGDRDRMLRLHPNHKPLLDPSLKFKSDATLTELFGDLPNTDYVDSIFAEYWVLGCKSFLL